MSSSLHILYTHTHIYIAAFFRTQLGGTQKPEAEAETEASQRS